MQSKEKDRARLSSEDRRAQIIDVALTLFAQRGFAKTRTKEIADTIGISETLIFQHFKTKDGLIRAALSALFHSHPVSGELTAYLEKVQDDAEFFKTLAMHLIEHNQKDPRILRLAIYSALEGGHFGELTRSDETGPSMLIMISSFIQKRIDQGAFIKVDAGIAARLFVEAVFMYIVDQVAEITDEKLTCPAEKVIDILVSVYLNGLRKQ